MLRGKRRSVASHKSSPPKLHSDVMQFWFKRKDLSAFLDSFSLYSKYAGTGEGEIEVAGNKYSAKRFTMI